MTDLELSPATNLETIAQAIALVSVASAEEAAATATKAEAARKIALALKAASAVACELLKLEACAWRRLAQLGETHVRSAIHTKRQQQAALRIGKLTEAQFEEMLAHVTSPTAGVATVFARYNWMVMDREGRSRPTNRAREEAASQRLLNERDEHEQAAASEIIARHEVDTGSLSVDDLAEELVDELRLPGTRSDLHYAAHLIRKQLTSQGPSAPAGIPRFITYRDERGWRRTAWHHANLDKLRAMVDLRGQQVESLQRAHAELATALERMEELDRSYTGAIPPRARTLGELTKIWVVDP